MSNWSDVNSDSRGLTVLTSKANICVLKDARLVQTTDSVMPYLWKYILYIEFMC